MSWRLCGFGETTHQYDTDFCTGILDTVFGIDFSEACSIHDTGYPWKTVQQKLRIDRVFFWKMVKCVKEQTTNPFHAFLGFCICFIRYFIVALLLGWLFWNKFPWTGNDD